MVVPLRAQYRMAADIMLLANTIVYDGQLRCGADHVAEAVLDLQVAPSQIGLPQWLTQVSLSYCAVFVMSPQHQNRYRSAAVPVLKQSSYMIARCQ